MKIFAVMFFISVLGLAVVAGGVMWTWDSWGAEQWAKVRGEVEEEEEKPEGYIAEMPGRPVVASAPIKVDAGLYEQYKSRDDVLVMVEYYADT